MAMGILKKIRFAGCIFVLFMALSAYATEKAPPTSYLGDWHVVIERGMEDDTVWDRTSMICLDGKI